MDTLNCALLAFLILSALLGGFIRTIARCFGEGAADGLIPAVVFAPLLVLIIAWSADTVWPPLTITAGLMLAWMAVTYLIFLAMAATHSFADEVFPGPHCLPKKTFGEDIDFRNEQFAGVFSKLAVRFRCRPTDTNLHTSLRARRYRYWILAVTRTTIICRNDSQILCDAYCNAGANNIGTLQEGGEELRAQMLISAQVARSYVQISVRMYAAMGAPKVVFNASGSAGLTSGSTAGLSVPVAPGTTVTAGANSGSSITVNGGFTITFPDASKVIEYDCGMFQWQCAPPGGEGVFLLDLAKAAEQPPPQEEQPYEAYSDGPDEPVVCGRLFSIRAFATGPTGESAKGRAQTQAYIDAKLACPGGCPKVVIVSWTPSVPVELTDGLWSCSGVGEYICR